MELTHFPQSLPRLLMQGEASVLDRIRLAFTPDEATDLLGKTHGVDLGDPPLRAAAGATEGWPGRGSCSRRQYRAVERLRSKVPPREVFEYLAAVVLEDLPAGAGVCVAQLGAVRDHAGSVPVRDEVRGRPGAAILRRERDRIFHLVHV